MSKVLCMLVVFLLVFPFVFGVKPSPQVSSSGLVVVYPKAQAFTFGKDFDFYVHIFNSSNGLPLDNSSVNCSLHIYNDTDNEHILNVSMSYAGHYDFEVSVSNGTFGRVGFYPYIVYCSNGLIGGFASDELLISASGEGEVSVFDVVFSFLVVIIPLFISWLFVKWSDLLGDDHNVFRLFLSFGSLIFVLAGGWFVLNSLTRFVVWGSMVDDFSVFVNVFVWLLFAIFGYWFVYLLWKMFSGMRGNKEDKMEYGK